MDENKNDVNAPNAPSPAGTNSVQQPTPQPVIPGDTKVVPQKPKKSKKKLIIILVVLLVVLLSTGIGAYLLINAPIEPEATTNETSDQQKVLGATLASIEGSVQYSEDAASWKEASGGESLTPMTYVRTAADSRAIVLFDDGSIVRLDSDTQVYLETLLPVQYTVVLETGQIYNRVVESETREYSVVTANDQFVAQGTAYKTSTDDEKDELEVYQSGVKVASTEEIIEEGNGFDTKDKEKKALDLEKLEKDEFIQWNKDQDSKSEEFKDKLGILHKESSDKSDNNSNDSGSNDSGAASLSLSASKTDTGIKLNWTLNGASAPKGFKVVRDASDTTPTYEENSSQYVSSGSTHTWKDTSGKTYNYRVCIYSGSGCGTYSNTVSIKSPFKEPTPVKSGGIHLEIDNHIISWELDGGTAPYGFKVVLSSSENPTYPSHSIKYVDKNTFSTTLPDKPNGTYYVRVCKYTNGTQSSGCVDYSNQVTYVVSD